MTEPREVDRPSRLETGRTFLELAAPFFFRAAPFFMMTISAGCAHSDSVIFPCVLPLGF